MAKLKDDEIKWILSLDASKTQQEIYKVSQANKELASSNKDIKKAMLDLEGQGKKNSDTWNNLKASYDQNAESISKNTLLIKEHEKTLGIDAMTMNQLKKSANDLQSQLNNTSKELNPEAYSKLEKELQATRARMVELNTATKQLPQSNAQLKAELGTLPGIFGEIQTKFVAGYQLVKNKTDEVIGTTKMLKQAINDKKVAVQLAKEADEAATAAELLLKKATAEGTATTEMATAAEKARAAATEASTVATSMGSNAMKIFKIALASTGIGILLVALGALVTYFTATNEGAKKFKQLTAGLSVYFQEFLSVAGKIGGVLFEAFSKPGGAITMLTGAIKLALLPLRTIFTLFNDIKQGNFGAALAHIKEAGIDGFKGLKDVVTGSLNTVKDLGGAISDSGKIISKVNLNTINSNAKMAMETEVSRQKLTKAEREWQSERIRIQGEIDVLEKKASKQSTLSSAEKLAAVKKAKEMRVNMFNTDLEYSKKNEDLVNKEQSFRSKKDYQAIQDAKNHTAQLVADKDSRVQGLQNKEGKANAALLSTQAAAYKKQQELKKKWEKILSDSSGLLENEDYKYQEKLKSENLFGFSLEKLSKDQLDRRIELEYNYYKKLKDIALKAETERFNLVKKEAGLDGDASKFKGQQLEAYQVLVADHERNVTKITLEEKQKREDFETSADKAILDSLVKANDSQLKVIDATKTAKLQAAKTEYADGKLTKKQYEDEIDVINSGGLADRLKAQQEFNDMVAGLEMAATPEYIAALQASQKAIADTQSQIDDEKIKKHEKLEQEKKKISTKYAKDSILGDYELRKAANEKEYSEGLISEQDYQNEKLKLKLDAAKKYTNQVGEIVSAGSNFVTSLQSAETASVQADYAKRIAALNQNDADYASKKEALQHDQAVAELDVQKKYADAQFEIQVAQIGVATATGIMNAWASAMTLGPILGPIAAGVMTGLLVGTGAAQIAAASAERDKVKNTTVDSTSTSSTASSISEGYADGGYDPDGGYTGDGGRYEVAGYTNTGKPIHKGEYYVAQPEMANPVAAQLVRKLENIRQQRTSSNPLPAGFADGGYDPDGGTGLSGGSGKPVSDTVEKLSKAIEAFNDKPLEINYWDFKKTEKKITDSYNLGSR